MNNRIVVQDPQTGERQEMPLPGGYFADMLIQDQTIYLRDFNRPGLLALDEATGQAVPGKSALGLNRPSTDLSQFSDFSVISQRTDDHQGALTLFDAHKVQLAVLSIQSEDYLGSARLLGRDAAGNFYVIVEELLENVPALLVDSSVRRYAPDGTYLDAALLPMPEIAYFPNRPVAIDPQGGAYFLKVTQKQAEVVPLAFSPAPPSTLQERWGALQESVQFKNDLQKKLDEAGVPNGPIWSLDQTLTSEQANALEMVKEVEHSTCGKIKVTGIPVKLSQTPGAVELPPPTLGQHTEEILTRLLGYSKPEVEKLKKEKVI